MNNHHDGLTPTQRAWLNSHSQREAFSDLSEQELNNLTYAEWARRTGQPTLGQIASQSTACADAGARSGAPAGNPTPSNSGALQAPYEAAPGLSLEEYALQSPEGFAEWRAQRKSSGENVGIFSGVMSSTAEYQQAAARHAGRTGYRQGSSAGAELMARRGRTIVRQNEIPPSGRRTFGY